MAERVYFAIDLKSFYASVECIERGLDPLNTHLVVADQSRTAKTICLAVTPSLKAHGISGRARLFEVIERVKIINAQRKQDYGHTLCGHSHFADEFAAEPSLALNFIVAPPRMAHYIKWSTRVYEVYLKYIAPEDIHVYSIDEVMLDATPYLALHHCTAREFASKILVDILQTTGITATAGIGSNLYLAKIAMDILAKHEPADQNGVRIAVLSEQSYRERLWAHRPITDFWRIGRGYAKKLAAVGLYTMGDIARCSLGADTDFHNEALLYRLFGVNAELLIDHAWGYEPCTIAAVKGYTPENRSICTGQVLQEPYPYDKAMLVLREMADGIALDLLRAGLVTDQLVLTIGYDRENVDRGGFSGEVQADGYGRRVPKPAHGTVNLSPPTCSAKKITEALLSLGEQIAPKNMTVRRLSVSVNHVQSEAQAAAQQPAEQLSLFCDTDETQQEQQSLDRERRQQQAILDIKQKFGKNAILRGTSLQNGATARERNAQIGGHRA